MKLWWDNLDPSWAATVKAYLVFNLPIQTTLFFPFTNLGQFRRLSAFSQSVVTPVTFINHTEAIQQ